MTDNMPIEDAILADLFLHRHSSRDEYKSLKEYGKHANLIARLVERGDVHHVGDGLFRITLQGQKAITDKYPELWHK
jgi:hypothetical protein